MAPYISSYLIPVSSSEAAIFFKEALNYFLRMEKDKANHMEGCHLEAAAVTAHRLHVNCVLFAPPRNVTLWL